ncbi:glycosyltransferase family 4 protein (plasmid) [Azospirillum sp. 412522]|nr:glycosyltransferase family 4 protein [Azospirillum sp. 412522]MBY6266403.1 glycosyltransferase family 4 protein [Azospirillum sp. 412522]
MARLLLINYEFPPLGGGAANATANTARELAALGVEVRVLTSAFAGLPKREVRDGYTIHRIATLRRARDRSSVVEMLAFLMMSLVEAPRLALGWRPNATIAYFGLPCGPAAWLVGRFTGTPYLISLRGGDVPGFLYDGISLYHRVAGPVIGWLWRRASAVVANSEGLAELARRFAPDVDVSIVPNGVDADLFRPAKRAEPAESGRAVLLFVGRVVRQKGLDLVLQALPALPAGVTLRVVGDGPARPALEAQAQALGIADRVSFLGWLGRDDLPSAYAGADLFVFPSRDEGMPNAVLEAMAAGLPVMGTLIAGNRDLIVDGETGLMVEADDAAGLCRGLERLVKDPELRMRMGAQGRRRVLEHFSWRAVASAYRDLALGTAPTGAILSGSAANRSAAPSATPSAGPSAS